MRLHDLVILVRQTGVMDWRITSTLFLMGTFYFAMSMALFFFRFNPAGWALLAAWAVSYLSAFVIVLSRNPNK